ncbi:hypothetical protein, partial [Klebsiella aerogenes]|uniref:hypothetical protein n=1 Tax=Klebsiella aerogenes TaxID=548 RepID=UPI001954CE98
PNIGRDRDRLTMVDEPKSSEPKKTGFFKRLFGRDETVEAVPPAIAETTTVRPTPPVDAVPAEAVPVVPAAAEPPPAPVVQPAG